MTLLNNSKPIWYNKISIELTVKELQILFDSVGCSNHNNRVSLYDNPILCPYDNKETTELYNQMFEILETQGGYNEYAKLI